MFERIIEIIVFVIGELNNNKQLADVDINKLQKLGYTSSEISTAFSWLVDRIEFSDDVLNENFAHSTNSFRVLHEAEEELFTTEAWGEMVQLKMLGLINNQIIESIIERALMNGALKIDSKILNSILAAILFNPAENSEYGSRVMLKGNDTIH